MRKIVFFSVIAAIASALPSSAQNNSTSPATPLTERELLNTIDSLGVGDPTKKAPLSIGDSTGVEARRENHNHKNAGEKKQEIKGATEITSQEASFDQKAHQAVFAGNVVVKNPEFNITCDKLTAFLRNENGKDKLNGAVASTNPGAVKPAAPQATPGPKSAKGPNSGGLEKVIAEGSVVITQDKLDADGNLNRSVGRARRAVYDSSTGDVILTGRPELQQGINACVATDDSTVIILNREGRMKVSGPSKTVIREAPENPTAPNAR